jgi:hypothetical protein
MGQGGQTAFDAEQFLYQTKGWIGGPGMYDRQGLYTRPETLKTRQCRISDAGGPVMSEFCLQ